MTASAKNVLTQFDALPPADQHEVVTEILRRSSGNGGSAQEPGISRPSSEPARKTPRFRIQLPPGAEPVSETLIRERR